MGTRDASDRGQWSGQHHGKPTHTPQGGGDRHTIGTRVQKPLTPLRAPRDPSSRGLKKKTFSRPIRLRSRKRARRRCPGQTIPGDRIKHHSDRSPLLSCAVGVLLVPFDDLLSFASSVRHGRDVRLFPFSCVPPSPSLRALVSDPLSVVPPFDPKKRCLGPLPSTKKMCLFILASSCLPVCHIYPFFLDRSGVRRAPF